MAEDRVRDEGTEDEDAARAAAVQALWEALHGGSDDAAADEPDDDADAADAGFRVASARDARVMMGSGHLAQVYSEDRSHKDLVAQWVWDHRKEIAGDAADWHNLYAAYNEKGLVRSAMQMALAGLERFPRDASLHADVIWSAADLGDWETGDEHLALVEQADNRAGEDWTLVKTDTVFVESTLSTDNFPILSFRDQADEYCDRMAAEGKVVVFSVYDPSKAPWERISAGYEAVLEAGGTPLVMLACAPSQLSGYAVPTGLPVYFADYKSLISLNRSNGGATYLSEGEIILKWSSKDTPSDFGPAFRDDAVNLSTWMLSHARLKAQGFCLYLAALLVLV